MMMFSSTKPSRSLVSSHGIACPPAGSHTVTSRVSACQPSASSPSSSSMSSTSTLALLAAAAFGSVVTAAILSRRRAAEDRGSTCVVKSKASRAKAGAGGGSSSSDTGSLSSRKSPASTHFRALGDVIRVALSDPSLHGRENPSPVPHLPWEKPNKPQRDVEVSEALCNDGCQITKVYVLPVPHLCGVNPERDSMTDNTSRHATVSLAGTPQRYQNPITKDFVILGDIVRTPHQEPVSRGYIRAGPRPTTYFSRSKTKAAIVTCGGLCPGLNNVIRQIVLDLYKLYGVEAVYGVKDGYSGFGEEPVLLTPNVVNSIHHEGGSYIGCGRGGFDSDVIISFLERNEVDLCFVIGGDGTMRAAHMLYEEVSKRRLPISIAGVPKTVDNDIGLIDRSFGFVSAVAEATRAIASAKVEAVSAHNGIGVVKLMGREAGFIAGHAALASNDVDLVLIPEIKVVLEGPMGVFHHLETVLKRKGHAVVVIAEGAGQTLLQEAPKEFDAGGNPKLAPIGPYLVDKIKEYFASTDMKPTIKYIDPSYIIRSVPANPSDSMYCMLLGQNVVHGAMAGFTGFVCGLVNNRVVYIPMAAIARNSPRVMDPVGRTWERILSLTGQADPGPDPRIASCTATGHIFI